MGKIARRELKIKITIVIKAALRKNSPYFSTCIIIAAKLARYTGGIIFFAQSAGKGKVKFGVLHRK